MKFLKSHSSFKFLWYAFTLVLAVLLTQFQLVVSVGATSATWASPNIYKTTDTTTNELYRTQDVYDEQIQVLDDNGIPRFYQGQVTYGQHIVFTQYTGQNNTPNWAVRSLTDQYFRRIQGIGISNSLRLVPGTDTLIWRTYTGNYIYGGLATTREAWLVLKPVENVAGFIRKTVAYKIDQSKARNWFTYVDGNSIRQRQVNGYANSPNGRYVVAWIDYNYQVKLNLDENTIQYIGYFPGSNSGGYKSNYPAPAAIDNTGRYVFTLSNRVVDTINCGKQIIDQNVGSGIDTNKTPGCPVTYLRSMVTNNVGYNGYDSYYRWVNGDRDLEFFTRSYSDNINQPLTRLVLSLEPYETTRLDYLALGDSYSSGEGDIDRKSDGTSYYTQETDFKGGCHLSTRSYPFLLRDYYHFDISHMRSVACSGAELQPDFITTPDTYYGQSSRLRGLSDADRKAKQEVSLQNFIPGNIPQLEFIKKYKPKIVTFTAGGNDIGFGRILQYCATPVWENAVFTVNSDCGYAQDNSVLRSLLDDAIDSQYDYTKLFINRIKLASPDTTVVIIGYPSFITSDNSSACEPNVGLLSKAEIRMINSEVVHMNNVLQRAAYDTGVGFVNTTHSLDGGRMCEGSKYVTGLADIGWNPEEYPRESFHPNHLGHQKIAQAIIDSHELISSLAPQSPPDVSQPTKVTYQIDGAVNNGVLYKDDQTGNLSVDPYLFEPKSTVTATMYSNTIDLGNYNAQGDGSLAAQIDTYDLPIGKHVLVLNGKSFSGEAVQYYQFLQVDASQNDADGDGTPNTEDPCTFIQHWYDETKGHDICMLAQSSIKIKSAEFAQNNMLYDESPRADKSVAGRDYAINEVPIVGRNTHKQNDILEANEPREWSLAILICGGLIGGAIYVFIKTYKKTH